MSRPTLTGERVVLTPMSWDHLEDLCALDADPEVIKKTDVFEKFGNTVSGHGVRTCSIA